MKKLALLALFVPSLAFPRWSDEFKANVAANVRYRLVSSGLFPITAARLARCMVDKAEREYPDEKKFREYISNDRSNNRLGERHLRECFKVEPTTEA